MKEKINISDLIKNNPDRFNFNFQHYFSKGFEICNQYAMGFILFFVLFMLISFIVGQLGIVGELVNRLMVTPVLSVGAYFVAQKISKEESYTFDEFWKGFQFLSPLITIVLIQYLIYIFFLSPILFSENLELYIEWFEEMQFNPSSIDAFPNFHGWYFLLLIPIIYLSVTWAYAPLLVVFYNLPAWDAMAISKNIVDRNWWVFALFYLIVALVSVSGALFFMIGILYTAPIGICIFYASFEDVMAFFLQDDDDSDLMKHLIEEGF